MAQISFTYPATGLTISVTVTNKTTNIVDFIGNAIEIGSTWVYVYTFTEAATTDYAYVATSVWYSSLNGIIYQDSFSSGWLTPTQEAQLASTVKTWDAIINLGDISIPL